MRYAESLLGLTNLHTGQSTIALLRTADVRIGCGCGSASNVLPLTFRLTSPDTSGLITMSPSPCVSAALHSLNNFCSVSDSGSSLLSIDRATALDLHTPQPLATSHRQSRLKRYTQVAKIEFRIWQLMHLVAVGYDLDAMPISHRKVGNQLP